VDAHRDPLVIDFICLVVSKAAGGFTPSSGYRVRGTSWRQIRVCVTGSSVMTPSGFARRTAAIMGRKK
jgi:hypothetical protein